MVTSLCGSSALRPGNRELRHRSAKNFEFQNPGVKVHLHKYPIVKMDWVDGGPLGVWLDARSSKTVDLQNARTQFRAISSFLEKEGIAHGDIQNGNVMMAPGGPRLIDYDARIAPVHSAQRPSRAAAQAAPPRPAVAAAPVPSPRPEIINTRIDAGAQCQYSPCE